MTAQGPDELGQFGSFGGRFMPEALMTALDELTLAWQEAMNKKYGLAELIVAKQRHGATGKVVLKFDPTITRFSDYAGY